MRAMFWIGGGFSLLLLSLPIDITRATEAQLESSPHRAAGLDTCPADPLLPPHLRDPLSCGEDPFDETADLGQTQSVDALSDVQPTDWAYQALKSLVEKYGVISGFPDRTFRGDRALSRYEFVATLAAVMPRIEQILAQGDFNRLREDFATLRRLQETYKSILALQKNLVNQLEATVATLEQQQFATTTRLNGQVVLGLTDGSNANTTIPGRVRIDFNTSFTGRDLLRTQLEVGNDSGDSISLRQTSRGANVLGTNGILADGGGLDYVEVPSTVRISKLSYTFQPWPNLSLTIGPRLNPRDFIDYNRFANDSLTNFNSSFFMNNPLIVQNQIDRPGGAGAAIRWQLGERSPFVLRALYVAADANDPRDRFGLFGGRNQGTVELEYTFRNLVTRLQYTSATINRTAINTGGINAEWAFSRQFSVFGRLGFGRYTGFNSLLQRDLSLSPVTWALGGTIREILIPGSVAGIAIGQPFIERDLGNATQTNVEVYYSFDLNDRVSFSPAFLIVANPNNRNTGAIFEWVVRLVYAF